MSEEPMFRQLAAQHQAQERVALVTAALGADGGVAPTSPDATPTTLAQAESPPAEAPKPAEAAAEAPAPTWPPGLLMDTLKPTDVGKGLDSIGLRIWGYIESGFTGRLTGGQDALPGRLYDARRPNALRLNQFQLSVDRPYDSTKAVDFGGRVDASFGGDAKLTHARGFFDKTGDGNGDAWFDLVQAYGQAWFKTGPDSGLEITLGKFLELAGSEVAEATYNALYSHSFIYSFAEPTTHTGGMVKYLFSPELFAYAGVVEGWDVFNDNNKAASFIAGGGWSSKQQIGGHARTQVLLNIITGPEQPHNTSNNRTLTDVVINHSWTEKLSESLNFDWVTEENVPGVGQENAYGPAHYLTYVFNDYLSGTWRAEWFRDEKGARIGTAGNFFENTWGVTVTPAPTHPILKNLIVRPELRWDVSTKPAFGGDRHNQVTAAVDVIFKF
jgi:hypothetical protein